MTNPIRRLAVTGLIAAAAVTSAACGAAGASSAPSEPPASAAPSALPPVIGPDDLVARAADLDGSPVQLDGFLLISDDRAQVCGIVAESYPPQCGGATIRVLGEVPQDVLDALDTTTNEPGMTPAWWGWVRIVGTVAAGADGPTITIDSIEPTT